MAPCECMTHSAERRDGRGGGRGERPARGSLWCVRSSRCAARHKSGFSAGSGAAGASSAACYLADDTTSWSGGVSIPTSMVHYHDEPSCLIARLVDPHPRASVKAPAELLAAERHYRPRVQPR